MEYMEIINQLSEKLAVPANELLKLLPQLAIKDIGLFIGIAITLLIGVVIIVIGTFIMYHKKNKYDDFWVFPFVLGISTFAISILCLVFVLPRFILAITNPQAWALDYLLQMF